MSQFLIPSPIPLHEWRRSLALSLSGLNQKAKQEATAAMAENQIQIVRFGILGCAKISRKIARAISLAPNSTLHAVASRSLDKAKEFASANGLPDTIKLYGSYDQVVDDPCVDVVYVPLPTSLHLHWAVLAAQKKKHLLLEKPTAVDVADLDRILDACRSNGVQFMDGSMWLHHPRTSKLEELLIHSNSLGDMIKYIYSTSTMPASPEFLENDVRVKPDMDSLGALGDLGWYCIGAVLWAKNYHLPTSVKALPQFTKNSSGVILSCTASFHYDQSTVGVIHCSFLSNTSMDLDLSGSTGSVHVRDLMIPFQEKSASFEVTLGARFADLHIGWNVKPEEVVVECELPQEALMVQELAKLVQGIKWLGGQPDCKWADISRKTQLVLDAVKKSVDLCSETVFL